MDTNSQSLCSGTGFICKPCNQLPLPSPPPPPPPSPPSTLQTPRQKSKWNYVFVIIGAVGGFTGVCSVIYWLFFCVCRREKVHNSVQPTIGARNGGAPNAAAASPYTSPSGSRSSIFIRQASRVMRRQRSGPSSSMKERAELFTLAELAVATNNFSPENKIGAGSFGQVYKGELRMGLERIKPLRGSVWGRRPRSSGKRKALSVGLAFLSRLNHKHLVGLIGYCEEDEERLLVYEFMKNGALYDHLHAKKSSGAGAGVLDSWKMRIKVFFGPSVERISTRTTLAVPPIIHRDIKSSNILLDGNWTARVSDPGSTVMGRWRASTQPMKAGEGRWDTWTRVLRHSDWR
ncbi:hypothetical protein J5N97_013723 [Dioscorea zingiberensis]|uniref:Protein kinase domain-containing protein n=1 Tax=Dioscorea zingiberensis TaxID=325984 RepID=A0A9D5CSH9_9LILI|nr:hypothetical protein J5N97_013723 [Dioscorea zingiberensis]